MAIDKTVQGVFERTMYLIDAQNETTGATETADTQDYRVRTLGILNSLLDMAYSASDTFVRTSDGTRSAPEDVTSFDDTLDLDARIVREVLPCGLAARLLAEENASLASYFWQCFEQGLQDARRSVAAQFEPVDAQAPYGGIEFGEFGQW